MRHVLALIFGVLALCSVHSGCATVKAVAATPAFADFDRIAVLGLSPQDESLFIPLYMSRFPNHVLVERTQLSILIGEQDMLQGRLDERTRAEIKRIFGVHGIVIAHVVRWPQSEFSVRVVNTETGAIVASAVVTGHPHASLSGVMEKALDAIKASLREYSR